MKQPSILCIRSLIGITLAAAISGGPVLVSLAQTNASNADGADGQTGSKKQSKRSNDTPPSLVTEAITAGVITTSGTVKVNDDVVPTGTTILSGSIIATGADGKALIDMGHQGLLEVQPNTKLWLNVPGGPIKVDLRQCGSITETVPAGIAALVAVDKQSNIRVTVKRGKVKVTRDGSDLYMKEKEEKTFDKVWLVTGISDSVFTLDCDGDLAAYVPTWPMTLLGLLMSAGAIAGSTIGSPHHFPTPQPTPPLPTPLFPD